MERQMAATRQGGAVRSWARGLSIRYDAGESAQLTHARCIRTDLDSLDPDDGWQKPGDPGSRAAQVCEQ